MCNTIYIFFGGQINKNKIGWACSTCGDQVDAYRVMVGRPYGKKPL